MNTAAKGSRAERRARRILEADGFCVTRAAGSKGQCDLVAWNAATVRFISVKSGTKYASAIERAALQAMLRPTLSTVEVWRFPDRCRAPRIELLRGPGRVFINGAWTVPG